MQYTSNDPGWRWPVFHLRFPEPRATYIMLEEGNPPPDSQRHPWERNRDLELDLNVGLPRTLRAMISRNTAVLERMKGDLSLTITEVTNEAIESTGLSEGLVSIAKRFAEERSAGDRAARALVTRDLIAAQERSIKNRARRQRRAARG